jgi:ribosomal protein S18 acetylase RimI-like enzyme
LVRSNVSSIANVRIGDVVSLRVATPLGPTDLVGTLVASTPETLSVRRRDGHLAEVAVADVRAHRVVPPGPERRIPVAELQRVAALDWRPLELDRLGEWWLRASGGFSRRGNSAMVVGDPGLAPDAALAAVADWYAERGLPARAQVVPAELPNELAALHDAGGWVVDAPTSVMTAALGPVLRGTPTIDVEVRVDEAPDEAWLAAYRADSGPLPDAACKVLVNHDSVGFVSVRDGARCAAIARVSVDGRWAGLSCVEVAPDRRRSGLATAASVAALRWAVSRGARYAVLQVTVDNTAARAAYERMGFVVHLDYEYRTVQTTLRAPDA